MDNGKVTHRNRKWTRRGEIIPNVEINQGYKKEGVQEMVHGVTKSQNLKEARGQKRKRKSKTITFN